jgi:hypothetical protein
MPSCTHKNGDRRSNEELRVAKPNPSTADYNRAKLSTTASLPRLPGHPRSLKSTSRATCFLSEHHSACLTDPVSSVFASPGSAALLKESLAPWSITAARSVLERNLDYDIPVRSSSYRHQPTDASTTSPPHSYISHYHTSTHPLSNRPIQKPTCLPSITREGRIVPLEGGCKQDDTNYLGPSPLLFNDPGLSQALLQPVQCLTHIPSLLDLSSQISSPEQQPQDLRHSSSFAALTRARELDRIIDARSEDKKKSL